MGGIHNSRGGEIFIRWTVNIYKYQSPMGVGVVAVSVWPVPGDIIVILIRVVPPWLITARVLLL